VPSLSDILSEFDNNVPSVLLFNTSSLTIHFDIALLTGLSISAVLSKLFNPTAFLSNG
jgi:hypothetical protein